MMSIFTNIRLLPYLIGFVFGISVVFAIYHNGYKKGYGEAENRYKAELNAAIKKYNEMINKTQHDLYETERAWLNEREKKEVVYRDRVKTVKQVVTKYIKDNSLSKCSIGIDGMHAVNKALSGTFKAEDKNK